MRHTSPIPSTSFIVFTTAAALLLGAGAWADTNTPLQVFGTRPIVDMAVSPDGTRVAVVCDSSLVRILDMATGEQVLLFGKDKTRWVSVDYAPDGSRVATGGVLESDAFIIEWDPTTGVVERSYELATDDQFNDLTYSSDGSMLVGVTSDGTLGSVVVLSTTTFVDDYDWDLDRHGLSVAVSPDGAKLLVGTNTDARLISTDTGVVDQVFTEDGYDVAFTPSGERVVTGGQNGVRVWSVATGAVLVTPALTDTVESVAVSGDGASIAVGTEANVFDEERIFLFDAQTGAELWNDPIDLPFSDDTIATNSVAFAIGNRVMAAWTTSLTEGTGTPQRERTGVAIYNLAGTVLVEEERECNPSARPFPAVALSRDGSRALTPAMRRAILWDTSTGEMLQAHGIHSNHVAAVAMTPDASLMASAATEIVLWDPATGNAIHTLTGHTEQVRGLGISPDGTQVVSASNDNTARLWDATTGAAGPVLDLGNDVSWASFSADGSMFLTACYDETVTAWNAATATAINTYPTGYVFMPAVWAPDSNRILTQTLFGRYKIVVWDPVTNTEITVMQIDAGMRQAEGLAFAPDGRYAFIGLDYPSLMKLWDLETETEIHVYDGHFDHFGGIAVSDTLILTADSGSSDRLSLLWETGWISLDGFESGDTSGWSTVLP